jgi:hypothetical protein
MVIPRLSNKCPIAADDKPFPKDETTPPVTKRNLLMALFRLDDEQSYLSPVDSTILLYLFSTLWMSAKKLSFRLIAGSG